MRLTLMAVVAFLVIPTVSWGESQRVYKCQTDSGKLLNVKIKYDDQRWSVVSAELNNKPLVYYGDARVNQTRDGRTTIIFDRYEHAGDPLVVEFGPDENFYQIGHSGKSPLEDCVRSTDDERNATPQRRL